MQCASSLRARATVVSTADALTSGTADASRRSERARDLADLCRVARLMAGHELDPAMEIHRPEYRVRLHDPA
jgi:hypothetical protein